MLCNEHGFSYLWHPNEPPCLVEGDFKVTCLPSRNVPIIFTNFLEDGITVSEANACKDVSLQPQAETEMRLILKCNVWQILLVTREDGRQPNIIEK